MADLFDRQQVHQGLSIVLPPLGPEPRSDEMIKSAETYRVGELALRVIIADEPVAAG